MEEPADENKKERWKKDETGKRWRNRRQKDLKQQVQQQELNIKTEQIWHWYTVRCHAWQQELLQPML